VSTGTVTNFSKPNRYGFIENDDGGEDVFFHITDVPPGVELGDKVEFEVVENPRRPGQFRASAVRLLI
jgi:CspA family cold shock protein